MNYKYFFWTTLIALICINKVDCQQKWNLEKCIKHAMDNNITTKNAKLNIENAEIGVDIANKARYPNLNASSNLTWNFGRTIDPTRNEFVTETFFSNNYGLNSNVTLFDGFRIKNNIDKSKFDLNASKADYLQSRNDIALTVAVNYLNCLFTKENIAVANNQLILNQQQLESINKSISAGALPRSESLNIEAQIAQNEKAIIVSENSYDLALFQLKQSLRIDPTEEINIIVPEEINVDTDVELITFDEIYQKAKENRYDLKAAAYRMASAMKDEEIAKAGQYPSLTFGGNLATNYSNQASEIVGAEPILFEQEFFINGTSQIVGQIIERPIQERPGFGSQLDQFLSYGFGFGLNIPIYNNGRTKGAIQRAKIGIEAQKLNYEQLDENLKLTVQQALSDARAAKKKLEASEKSLVIQQQALDNVSKRLEMGASNSFEWESQNTQVESAELTRLIDKYDYLFKIKIVEFYLGKPLKL